MKANITKISNIKYTNIQLLHNAMNCVVLTYATIFLKFKGFTNTEVGIILSIGSILSIIIQPAIASFADKTDKVTLRQIALFLTGVNIILSFFIIFASDIKPLAFVLFVPIYALQMSVSSIVNALATEYLNKGIALNFGLARGAGSFAYAVFSILLGFIIGIYNPNILIYISVVMYGILFAIIYSFRLTPDQSESLMDYTTNSSDVTKDKVTSSDGKDPAVSTFEFLKKYKEFTFFLIGVTLMCYSYNLTNTYFINIHENIGGNDQTMGIGLGIAAFLELPVMVLFVFLLRKFKCSSMIKFSAVFYFIKALLTLLAPNVMTLYFAQTLQLFSFALFTPAGLYYVNTVIPRQDSVKGQTMINIATFGISSVIASLTGGIMQDTLGVSAMLLIGTVVTAIGVMIIFKSTEDTGYAS